MHLIHPNEQGPQSRTKLDRHLKSRRANDPAAVRINAWQPIFLCRDSVVVSHATILKQMLRVPIPSQEFS